MFLSSYYGIIQAGFRELLSEVLTPTPKLGASDNESSTTTDCLSTPKTRYSSLDLIPAPLSVSKTPSFVTQNKFTKVGVDYVPQSPTYSIRRQSAHSRSSSFPELLFRSDISKADIEIESAEGNGDSDDIPRALTPEKEFTLENQVEFSTPKKRSLKTLEPALDYSPCSPRTRGKRSQSTRTGEDGPVKRRRS